MAAAAVWAGIPGGRAAFAETSEDLSGDLSGTGMAFLRLAVRGDDAARGGSGLLGSRRRDEPGQLPGDVLHLGAGQRPGGRPLLADDHRRRGCHGAHRVRGRAGRGVPADECARGADATACRRTGPAPESAPGRPTATTTAHAAEDLVTVPLWVLIGGRSGDKGGDANVGLWADTESVADWLCDSFDVDAVQRGTPRGGTLRGQPVPAPQPARRQLRRARHPRLGRRLQSPARYPGQGDGGAAPFPSRRGALASRGQRPAGAASGLDTDLTKGCPLPTRRDGQRATATGVNSQRRCLIPLIKVERRRSGSPQAAMSGRRSNS